MKITMKRFNYNPILIGVIIIGLIAALVINYQRNRVEEANNTVDLALSYQDVRFLAQSNGSSIPETLKALKEAGITSISVDEMNFKTLNETGEASLLTGGEILRNYESGSMNNPAWRHLVESGKINGNYTYVVGHDKVVLNQLKNELVNRLGANRVQVLTAGTDEVLQLSSSYETIEEEGLGLNRAEMETINAAGLYVIPRPSNYEIVNKEKVDAFFKQIDGINVSEIVFAGKQALGNPGELQYVADKMLEKHYTLGLIEAVSQLQFYKQNGALDIAKVMDYKVARLYAIPKDEQPKLAMATAVERWANTDEERNIRIDLLRAYEKPLEGETVYSTNIKYIKDTRDILLSKGFNLGPATYFKNYYPNKVLQILVYMGIVAGAVLYLTLIFPEVGRKRELALWAVLSLIGIAILTFSVGGKLRILASLTAANVFPAIAMIVILDNLRQRHLVGKAKYSTIVIKGIKSLALAFVISMIGAMFLSGILSDITYFLEVNIFRGIKLTFVLPMILVAVAFLRRFDIFGENVIDPPPFKAQIKRILDLKITVKSIAALFVILIAGIIFVGRSGHTDGIPVPAIELKIRAFLEQAFYARPRSKELFIGHPAFMLMIMAWYRKWPSIVFFALTMLATIGQGSMVETFAHMRTPVFMSFMRGFDGALWGCIIGIVAITLITLWTHFTTKEDRSKSLNE